MSTGIFTNKGKGTYKKGSKEVEERDIYLIKTGKKTSDFENDGEGDGAPFITANELSQFMGNMIISGSKVSWISGYTFLIPTFTYIIRGKTYTSPEKQVTLDSSHATLDRIDSIILTFDSQGNGLADVLVGVEGDPAAKRNVNNETQIEVTFINVDRNTTEPGFITNLDIYEENVEFTGASFTAGTPVDFAYPTNPFSQSLSTNVADFTAGDYFTWTNGSTFAPLDYDGLQLQIEPTSGAWEKNSVIEVAFFNGVVRESGWVLIDGKKGKNKPYGINSNDPQWQTVYIPTSEFQFQSNTVDNIQFRKAGPGTISFKMDLVRMQTGTPIINNNNTKTLLSEFINDVPFITMSDLPETSDLIDLITVGENVVLGDHVYLSNDGKWWKTNANSETTSTTEVRVALGTILADAMGSVLIKGSVTLSGLVAGDKYWLDESAGTITNDYSGFADTSIVRYIGTAISTTEFEYNPDKTSIRKDGSDINGVSIAGAVFTPIENEYLTMAALYADQGNQTDKFIQYVADASGHPDFGVIPWYFEYLGTVVGDETDYRPLTQQEVSTIQLQVDWDQTLTSSPDYIKGKPTNLSDFTNDLLMAFGIADMVHGTGDDITIIDGVSIFRPPFGIELTDVYVTADEAPTGSDIICDITLTGVSILSTLLRIDAGEEGSNTSATPPVISTTTIPAFSEIGFNIDQIGSTLTGKGLKFWLVGTKI